MRSRPLLGAVADPSIAITDATPMTCPQRDPRAEQFGLERPHRSLPPQRALLNNTAFATSSCASRPFGAGSESRWYRRRDLDHRCPPRRLLRVRDQDDGVALGRSLEQRHDSTRFCCRAAVALPPARSGRRSSGARMETRCCWPPNCVGHVPSFLRPAAEQRWRASRCAGACRNTPRVLRRFHRRRGLMRCSLEHEAEASRRARELVALEAGHVSPMKL